MIISTWQTTPLFSSSPRHTQELLEGQRRAKDALQEGFTEAHGNQRRLLQGHESLFRSLAAITERVEWVLALQARLFTELFPFQAAVFYLVISFAAVALTSTRRTERARVWA